MSSTRIISGVLICLAALVGGAGAAWSMGGLGICGSDVNLGLIMGSVLVGAVFSGSMAVLWRKVWWLGALLYSVPSVLLLPFLAAGGEWRRVGGMCVYVVGSILAAFIVRYPSPRSLKTN
jgi:hypothetical protein